ncbi:MAG TPA: hypothetical protein VKV26_06365 [Dehalococcoidia bacterium]|nr:hypothetical protein [Dehalococcoidia bacterium]
MSAQDDGAARPAHPAESAATPPAEAPLDPVEEADEESFPASDPPPGPAHIGGPSAPPERDAKGRGGSISPSGRSRGDHA